MAPHLSSDGHEGICDPIWVTDHTTERWMPTTEEQLRTHRRLAEILGCADDEAFLLMVWGVNALQSGNPEGGSKAFPFGFPPEAVTQDMGTALSVYPWELETLVNELLASPKSMYRTLSCNSWGVVPEIVNQLRRVDDADFSARRDSVNIFNELYRIGGRQFDWQRGYANLPQLYRNIYIYGQGECANYFFDKYGITVSDFVTVGFGLFASLKKILNSEQTEIFRFSVSRRSCVERLCLSYLPRCRRCNISPSVNARCGTS